MKRKLIILVLLAMLISALAITVNAETIASGQCTPKITWSLDDQGILTISGTGEMRDYKHYSDAPWQGSGGGLWVKEVVIEEGITKIGSSAFENYSLVEKVTIADSVTKIGTYAFSQNNVLTDVTLPDQITFLGDCAFSMCPRLTNMTIPNGVTRITSHLFYACTGLTSVTIPSGVTYIDQAAFNYCNSLNHVFYGGTQEQWNNVEIDLLNAALTQATIHYNMEGYTEIGCTQKGIYCSVCNETIVSGDAHSFDGGFCTVCGEADPDFVPETSLLELKGSSMTLGNTLEINFAIATADITGDNNYIVVSKENADGSEVFKTYPQAQWNNQESSISYISFGVTAKEMNDKLTVIVYNEEGQQISEAYTDSVAGYCLRKLREEENSDSPSAKDLTLFVDMLNYGAAAQTKWNYNANMLANAGLTENQKRYATVIGEKNDIRLKGEGYYGTSLSLKDNILMNIAYEADFLTNVAYAEVNFVGHNGVDKSMTVAVENFVTQGSVKYISIDVMAVADYAQPVTVKLYNAAGECVSTTVDSMGSYAGRQTKDVYLYEAILAFGMGAYSYFHS